MSANFREQERNRPLSIREREQIRNRMRMNEQALEGHVVVPTNRGIGPEGLSQRREGHWGQFLRDDVKEDAGLLRAKITRDRKLLEMNDPKNLDKKRRVEIEQQIKRDTEFVKKRMCPKKLFFVSRNHPDFQKAVDACKPEHTLEYKQVASRLKENLRRIDPDSEANLERFRPKN